MNSIVLWNSVFDPMLHSSVHIVVVWRKLVVVVLQLVRQQHCFDHQIVVVVVIVMCCILMVLRRDDCRRNRLDRLVRLAIDRPFWWLMLFWLFAVACVCL